jgi:hypothetical protein
VVVIGFFWLEQQTLMVSFMILMGKWMKFGVGIQNVVWVVNLLSTLGNIGYHGGKLMVPELDGLWI